MGPGLLPPIGYKDSPVWCQANTQTNADLLLVRLIETNLPEISIKLEQSLKKNAFENVVCK